MADGPGERSSPPESSHEGLVDTVPASEPPTDIDGNPMRASRASIPPFQRYRLGAELGRGGMGRVVEAFDTQLGRTVALKEVLPKGAAVARRFLREVQITARLEHPAIVPLYDSGTTPDGRPFYVMRRVTGRPLDEMIKRAPNLEERLALLPAVLAAIDAVAHAHRRGVIHRDLKPANILVGELGETVVIDWGLAKVVGEDETDAGDATKIPTAADSLQTQMGSVFGTPGFMPPEQARGEEPGTQGDVYALGATLYQLLAGAPPHTGTSATEVLGRTLVHDVEPLDETAPGAPPELVAIVDKALSFEPETRYQNAGKLGEDVRRFLTGQLVAAHNYTPGQRLGRFAKRHRAALTIAALASVVLAVLAWVSVSRVMTERDAATEARAAAVVDKQAAERARDHLAERNDALIVTQARALVELNPTEAIATLKQLDPSSPRIGDAKAVAQAAVMRGVWWGMKTTGEMTLQNELSFDGRLLLQVSFERGGQLLRVWDLDRRKLVSSRPYGRTARATWIAGGKILAYDGTIVPEVVDPQTGKVSPLALPPFTDAETDATGAHLLVLGKDKEASLYTVASGTLQALWPGHRIHEEAMAPDGSWVALSDDKELVIVDASGRLLGQRTGNILRVAASGHRQVAFFDKDRVMLSTLDPKLDCHEVAVQSTPNQHVLDLAFRDDELDFFVAGGDLLGFRNYLYTVRTGVRQYTFRLAEAADHVMIVPSADGKLFLTGDSLSIAVALPAPVPFLRMATRPGQSRVVVTGTGMILVLDLDAITPRRIAAPLGTHAAFVDDDTLLSWGSLTDAWEWIDVLTGKRTPFSPDADTLPTVVDLDSHGGRALWGRLLLGDAVVFGNGDGTVFAKVGETEPHEVVKLDGSVVAAGPLGPLAFTAISERGEVVRGNLANGALDRTNVAPGKSMFVAGVLIVVDDRLLVWDHDRVVLLQQYDRKIARLDPTENGVVVQLVDNELQLIDTTGAAAPRRLFAPSSEEPVVAASGKIVVGTGTAQQLLVVELPTFARWDVPVVFASDGLLAVAPQLRRVLQNSQAHFMLWELPQVGADFGAWLDEQTNALKRDDLLAWPWQTPLKP